MPINLTVVAYDYFVKGVDTLRKAGDTGKYEYAFAPYRIFKMCNIPYDCVYVSIIDVNKSHLNQIPF